MQIKDFFEHVYVINLPDRKDRYRQMVHELEKAGMPLSRNKIEIFPAIRPSDARNFPNVGALGCFLSHLSILKQAKKDGLANVLILEDDLVISERFRTDQAVIVEQLSSVDWGFVYFGHREEVAKAYPVEHP